MEFGYITSGTAAKKITNGIEVYSTGPDTSSDTATFFNYNEAIKEGETYYQATIQVTGMKEGYTIVGVRGWESVTITQDGEYILPAYTWTNEQGLPEGSDIYNDYKPALKFAVGTESNVVWDEPITLVITAVETMEQSVQKAMVLWYDLKKQGATNESMASNPTLRDLSGNGHDATCYNFAWSGMSGIGGYDTRLFTERIEGSLDYIRLIDSYTIHISKLSNSSPLQSSSYWDIGKLAFRVILNVQGLQEGQDLFICQYNNNWYGKVQLFEGRNDVTLDFTGTDVQGNLTYWYATFYTTTPGDFDVTIKLEPMYPGALVSDGVDDCAIVENLPLLTKEKGYTVIAKRTWIGDINSKSQGFVSKGTFATWRDGAFYFECVEGGGTSLFNRVFPNSNSKDGLNEISSFAQENLTYLTSAKYNNSDIVNVGDGVDTDKLVVFRLSTSSLMYYASISLYSLLLFNRDLTSNEIEWVKTNLIETEQ